jgi:hypothetical protein
VPNGVYAAIVDFGENHYSQGCETEGILCHGYMGGTGDAGTGCIFSGPVSIMDGRLTVTGRLLARHVLVGYSYSRLTVTGYS